MSSLLERFEFEFLLEQETICGNIPLYKNDRIENQLLLTETGEPYFQVYE